MHRQDLPESSLILKENVLSFKSEVRNGTLCLINPTPKFKSQTLPSRHFHQILAVQVQEATAALDSARVLHGNKAKVGLMV